MLAEDEVSRRLSEQRDIFAAYSFDHFSGDCKSCGRRTSWNPRSRWQSSRTGRQADREEAGMHSYDDIPRW